MASSTLDVPVGARPDGPPDAGRRRLPATVVAASGLAVGEGVALVALGLTGLGSLLQAPDGPPGLLAVLVVLGLAGWAVAAAGGGLVLADGTSGRLYTGLAYAEFGLLGLGLLLGLLVTAAGGSVGGLAGAVGLLLAAVVPAGKLLLASAPSTSAWLAAGPRPARPQPVLTEGQRVLRGVTVCLIGLMLVAVALTGSADDATAMGTDAPTQSG